MSIIGYLIEWTKDTFFPYGPAGLFFLAFIESSFFPIPPDILLIALSLANPEYALLFALIATIGSVLGGIFGYYIGFFGEKLVLEKMFDRKKIQGVHKLFNKYEAWAIFIAAFTPIPYKVFTIGAGVFYVNFKKFIVASVIGRGMRFFSEAVLLMYFGNAILSFIENYFDVLTLIGVVLLIGVYFVYKLMKEK